MTEMVVKPSQSTMKKLLNDPFDFVEESLEGFLMAHADTVKRVGKRAVGRAGGPTAGKVGVVVGGGSGHLPAFIGYVGKGGADAAPVGNIFASPPAKPVLEATLAANGGAGVLYSYGNYAGDVMNFDRAAAQAAEQGVPVETVLVTDDVASAPKEETHRRRGIAGDFFVFKAAAAKAETMADLAAVKAAGLKPESIDLDAFALVRTLADPGEENPDDLRNARVLCHLGGTTNLAIAAGSICRTAEGPGASPRTPGIFEQRRMALTPAEGCGAGALARPGPLP